MVKCLLWLEFEVKKLDTSGEKQGLAFFRGFTVNANNARIDLIEIYEMQSFEIPVLLASGKWESDRWLLSSKHNNCYLLDKIDQTFEECFTPYVWIE
jgi:hypothetical protein